MSRKREAWRTRLTDVIAERTFQLRTEDGRHKEVHLRFGRPQPLPKTPGYYCVSRTEGLEARPRTRCSEGLDSLQALQFAMDQALLELVLSREFQTGRLSWEGIYELSRGFLVPQQLQQRLEKLAEVRAQPRRHRSPRKK